MATPQTPRMPQTPDTPIPQAPQIPQTPQRRRRRPSRNRFLPPLYTPKEVARYGYRPRRSTTQRRETPLRLSRRWANIKARNVNITESPQPSTPLPQRVRGSEQSSEQSRITPSQSARLQRVSGRRVSTTISQQEGPSPKPSSTSSPFITSQQQGAATSTLTPFTKQLLGLQSNTYRGTARPSSARRNTLPLDTVKQVEVLESAMKRPRDSPEEESPSKRRSAPDSNPTSSIYVRVYVGEDRKGEPLTFIKRILRECSPYFEKALRAQEATLFAKADTPSLVFKHTTRNIFELFRRYIYQGVVQGYGTASSVADLIKIRVLAGKIATPKVQNKLMLEISEHKDVISISGMVYIYKKTDQGSPLRKFVINQMMRQYSTKEFESLIQDNCDVLPMELLADLIIVQRKWLNLRDPLPAFKVENYYV